MPDGVQQVRLAQPRVAVDEQRVVRLGRGLGDRDGGRVGEPVARADDEGVEGVFRVEPGELDLLGELVARARPAGPGDLDEGGDAVPLTGRVGDGAPLTSPLSPSSSPMSRSSICRRRSATRRSWASSEAVSSAGPSAREGSTVTASRTSRPSWVPSVDVTRSRSLVSTMSLVKSLGTAMSAVSSSSPTSRASERKALCCTGIPSESRTSRVVRHSSVIVASATRLPLPSAARRADSSAPGSRERTPSTWLSTDCGYAAWSPEVCRAGRRAVLRAILWAFPSSGYRIHGFDPRGRSRVPWAACCSAVFACP